MNRSTIVDILLDHGADVNLANADGATPILCAALTIKRLVQIGASLDVQLKAGSIYHAGTVIDQAIASRNGPDMDVVSFLVQAGAKYNFETLARLLDRNRDDILEVLIKAGADVNIRDPASRVTLLERAIAGRWNRCAKTRGEASRRQRRVVPRCVRAQTSGDGEAPVGSWCESRALRPRTTTKRGWHTSPGRRSVSSHQRGSASTTQQKST